MHVYPVVIAAIAAISNPSHRGRNHTVGRSVISGSSLEDRLKVVAPGQVSWLSDRPTPRVFPASRPVTLAGFVPDYSDGVAAVSHRLPLALVGHPGRVHREPIRTPPQLQVGAVPRRRAAQQRGQRAEAPTKTPTMAPYAR